MRAASCGPIAYLSSDSQVTGQTLAFDYILRRDGYAQPRAVITKEGTTA